MALTVAIDEATGPAASPTWNLAVSFIRFSRDDSVSAQQPTAVPTPAQIGTNYSFHKSFAWDVVANPGGLTATGITVGVIPPYPVVGEAIWSLTSHTIAQYAQATTPPVSTVDNNVTPPVINGRSAVKLPLNTSFIPSYYATTAQPAALGRQGNLVELACGVDNSILGAIADTSQRIDQLPTIIWYWLEG